MKLKRSPASGFVKEFTKEVFLMIQGGRYKETTIVYSVNSVLNGLGKGSEPLKAAIRADLLKEIPYLPWTFKPLKQALKK